MNNQLYLISKIIEQVIENEKLKWTMHYEWAEETLRDRRSMIQIQLGLYTRGWKINDEGRIVQLRSEDRNERLEQIHRNQQACNIIQAVYYGEQKARKEREVIKEIKREIEKAKIEISRNTQVDWNKIKINYSYEDYSEIYISEN